MSSSRSRGHKVKSDIASMPLLRHIPTKSMVSEKMQPLYYELLHCFGAQELDTVGQSIAVLLARDYCTLQELYQYRDKVLNEADAPSFRVALEDADRLKKSYCELAKTFQILTRQTKQKEEVETPQMNPTEVLQKELMRLRKNDSGDNGEYPD